MPDSAPLERFLAARADVVLRSADLGESRFALYEVEELAEAQLGYAVGADDEDLTGDEPGQWRPLWLVVGEEELGQVALLVDLGDPRLPVLIAEEDDADWAPVEIAETYAGFVALLADLQESRAQGADRDALLAVVGARTPTGALRFWESWL